LAKQAAQTAAGPAVVVAIEQQFPEHQRLLNAPLARRILPTAMRFRVDFTRPSWMRNGMIRWVEKKVPGVWAIFPVRKRYIADKVSEALSEPLDAIVNLGAGFDTLAHRLPAVPFWEVDQPGNIEAKRAGWTQALGKVPDHVTLVPTDFDSEELTPRLAAHGYTFDKKTFFILEAVTQYLTEAGVQQTFEVLANAAPGSRLAFTYVRKDFLDGKALHGLEAFHKKIVVKDKVWLFGIAPDELAAWLEGYGWRVLEHVGYADLTERYVAPTGRDLGCTPIERLVYAEKM